MIEGKCEGCKRIDHDIHIDESTTNISTASHVSIPVSVRVWVVVFCSILSRSISLGISSSPSLYIVEVGMRVQVVRRSVEYGHNRASKIHMVYEWLLKPLIFGREAGIVGIGHQTAKRGGTENERGERRDKGEGAWNSKHKSHTNHTQTIKDEAAERVGKVCISHQPRTAEMVRGK